MQRGIDLRIEAAAQIDAAKPLPKGEERDAALEHGAGELRLADEAINAALAKGVRLPVDKRPTRLLGEASERALWGRAQQQEAA
jgi:hypothetical protein